MEEKKRRNQEQRNLTAAEKRGISKLRKRIEKDEMVIVKTDKSGKLGVISKERYLKTDIKGNGADKEVNRDELKKIEKNLNDHTRMICKVVNAGEYNGHIDRILSSKIVNSESTAPKYYLFKDHKKSESWRPVVSGCSSNTLGLSNMLSDIVESICGSMKDSLEVISSEDLLSGIETFNKWAAGQKSDWRTKYMLIGSDVTALFPSLTKRRTAEAIYNQAEKSKIAWSNIDEKWLTLYIHLNQNLSSHIGEVSHLLPKKRPHKRGREPGMSSFVCMQRFIEDEYEISGGKIIKNSWVWPETKPTKKDICTLMAIMLEISVSFFFDNFIYTFGGKEYLQCSGGPIGARLTMCISRLMMQDWWEKFVEILDDSKIDYKMSALYVDDGRIVIEILKLGVRFDEESKLFKYSEAWYEEDKRLEKSDPVSYTHLTLPTNREV